MSDPQGGSDISERIQRVKDAYDAERRRIEANEDDGLCDLCKVVAPDRTETVENEETGEKMDVDLCEDCWRKTKNHAAGKDVDFMPELRLRERQQERVRRDN